MFHASCFMTTLADNKDARHRYQITDTYEAGVKLLGQEVKAVKAGQAQLRGSYVSIRPDKRGQLQAYLINARIEPYKFATQLSDYQPDRERRLLLHQKEITQLYSKTQTKGLTLVALRFYTKNGLIKLAIGLGKGKQLHDKREAIKKRDTDRDIRRAGKTTVR